MVRAKRVIWPQKARKQLREAYEYIKLDSVQNAEKVRKEILSPTRQLAVTPKVHRSFTCIAFPIILVRKK